MFYCFRIVLLVFFSAPNNMNIEQFFSTSLLSCHAFKKRNENNRQLKIWETKHQRSLLPIYVAHLEMILLDEKKLTRPKYSLETNEMATGMPTNMALYNDTYVFQEFKGSSVKSIKFFLDHVESSFFYAWRRCKISNFVAKFHENFQSKFF